MILEHVELAITHKVTDHSYGTSETHVMLLILIALSFITIIGNILQFLAVSLEPSLQTASNLFILSLGCSDFVVGVWTLPIVSYTVYRGQWEFSANVCQFAAFLDSMVITVSMWTLGLTALDRCLLVSTQFNHKRFMTKQRASCIIGGIWFFSAVCAAFPLVGWSEYGFSSFSMSCAMKFIRGFNNFDKYYFLFYVLMSFPTPMVIIIISYVIICRASVNRGSRNSPAKKAASITPSRARPFVNNIRTAKITLVLILFVLACILPTFIISIVFWFEAVIPFSHEMSKAVIWSLLSNSACNPILYGWVNHQFREVYHRMLWCIILRQKYTTVKRTFFSMKSIKAHNQQSLASNTANGVMNSLHPTPSNSCWDLKRYSQSFNSNRGNSPAPSELQPATPTRLNPRMFKRYSDSYIMPMTHHPPRSHSTVSLGFKNKVKSQAGLKNSMSQSGLKKAMPRQIQERIFVL